MPHITIMVCMVSQLPQQLEITLVDIFPQQTVPQTGHYMLQVMQV